MKKDSVILLLNADKQQLEIIVENDTLIVDFFQKDVNANYIKTLSYEATIKVIKKLVSAL